MRRPARLVLAAGVLTGLALPCALAGPAAAQQAQAARGAQEARGARQLTGSAVTMNITSVNPAYAKANQKVTVQGTLTNATTAPLTGLTIQLRSSGVPFSQESQLQLYAAGTDPGADSPERGTLRKLTGTVQPGGTVHWKAVLPANAAHMTSFGVYPLAAQATSAAGGVLAISRTFLPYWPSAKGAARPRRDDVAWLWPLIDVPDQGPCQGLLNNRLATSLSGSGRLAGLLSAGRSAAGQAARLTWVIDPALLSSAQIMKSGSYVVGANRFCQHGTTEAASTAAASWLSGLRSAVTGHPAFVTPYSDVDIAALTKENLDSDLRRAFQSGRSVASSVLGRSFTPEAGSGRATATALTSAAAWPTGGRANYAMLQDLAAVNGIRTVVLSTSAMPPTEPLSYTPSAVTSTNDGEGGELRVLLTDSTLTQVLSSVTAGAPPAAVFAARQRFLAQTAMIAAQDPQLARAIVIAPPRRWNPPAGLATALLSETSGAPWLSPVSAGALAAAKNATGRVARQQPTDVGRHQLSASLLRQVRAAGRGVRLVENLRVNADPQLRQAVAGIESSAWRRSPSRARSLLRKVTTYIDQQEKGVSIIGPGRDTLGGQRGFIPVSVDNRLGYAIRLKVALTVNQAPGAGFTVLTDPGVIEVPANTIYTKKVKVTASTIGSTTINLRLLTPEGQQLPGQGVTVTVQATHFGTFALIILAAALGVFMITSAARAARRGRSPAGPDSAGRPGEPAGDQPAGDGNQAAGEDEADDGRNPAAERDAPHGSGARGHEQPVETDNVGHGRAESGTVSAEHVQTEDADDYAPVAGWADRS